MGTSPGAGEGIVGDVTDTSAASKGGTDCTWGGNVESGKRKGRGQVPPVCCCATLLTPEDVNHLLSNSFGTPGS